VFGRTRTADELGTCPFVLGGSANLGPEIFQGALVELAFGGASGVIWSLIAGISLPGAAGMMI
jgi:hypothetical protein